MSTTNPFPPGGEPEPHTPLSAVRHWHHRHYIEAAFDRPTVLRCGDVWFISSEAAVEMRRLGLDELFDHRALLITRQRQLGPDDPEVLDVCWLIEDWMVSAPW